MGKKIAIIGAMAFALIASFGSTVYASKSVVKYYKLDSNLFTMQQTIFDEVYKCIPDNYVYYSNSKTLIESGWNYNRYQFTNYYKDHQSII